MHTPDSRNAEVSGPDSGQPYGPSVGEPPPFLDPRRSGSLIGLAGALVFIVSYSGGFDTPLRELVRVLGVAGVLAALFFHYVRPRALGLLARVRPVAIVTYLVCVVAELALIAAGSRVLESYSLGELRPALIALVVGLHFIPFAWLFSERMFLVLGSAVGVIGAAGLAAGILGVTSAAAASAVLAGFVMLFIIILYAQGRFARA